MKEELISFKTAQLAKSKGFNWEVSNSYIIKSGKQVHIINMFKHNANIIPEELFENINHDSKFTRGYISAPTQSLLQKWLREERNIYIDIRCAFGSNGQYFFSLHQIVYPYRTLLASDKYYNTYEEVLEDALFSALVYL